MMTKNVPIKISQTVEIMKMYKILYICSKDMKIIHRTEHLFKHCAIAHTKKMQSIESAADAERDV